MTFIRLKKRIEQDLEQRYQKMRVELSENDSLFSMGGRLRSTAYTDETIRIIKKHFSEMLNSSGKILEQYTKEGYFSQKLNQLLQDVFLHIWERFEADFATSKLLQLHAWRDNEIELAKDKYIQEPAEKLKTIGRNSYWLFTGKIISFLVAAFIGGLIGKFGEQAYTFIISFIAN